MKTLINKYTLIAALFITNILSVNAQTPVLTAANDNPEYACPGSVTYFNLEPNSTKATSVKWIVTGGYFNEDPNVTEVTNNYRSMSVNWKNVSCSNGTNPKGTLKAIVTYDFSMPENKATSPLDQKIKSLNGDPGRHPQTDAIFALEGFAPTDQIRAIDALAGRVSYAQVAEEMTQYARQHLGVEGFVASRPWA